jgi:hypothetical protein
MNEISQMKSMFGNNMSMQSNQNQNNNIFEEINSGKYEGNKFSYNRGNRNLI